MPQHRAFALRQLGITRWILARPYVLLIPAIPIYFFWRFWLSPSCQSACDHQASVDSYTRSEVGPSVVNIVDGLPWPASPYCLDGCLSLDPHSRQNRIDTTALPTAPVDLRQAVGADTSAPPLKVVYSIADELLLAPGSKLSIPLNDTLSVHYCLNNPDLRVDEDDSCTQDFTFVNPSSGVSETVLALEKDLRDPGNVLSTAIAAPATIERFSGTVIFAKKVVICGWIETGGYDLVIVADDVEFQRGSRIDTSPPTRPVGPAGYYDYGYAGAGFDGGDVVLLAKNIIGTVDAVTNGQAGGKERQYFSFDPLEFHWSTRLVEFEPPPSFIEQLPPGNPMRRPEFRFFDQHHVFDVGEQGRGGRGGRAGTVTIVSTSSNYAVQAQQDPGPGAEPQFTVSPELVRERVETDADRNGIPEYTNQYRLLESGVPLTDDEQSAIPLAVYRSPQIHDLFSTWAAHGKLIGPYPFACDGGILMGLLLAQTGTRICTAYEPTVHANCQLQSFAGDLYWCNHVHRQLDNIDVQDGSAPVSENPDESVPPTCGILHCWCEEGYTLANGRCYPNASEPAIETDDTGLITCNTRPELLDCVTDDGSFDPAAPAQLKLKIWGKRGLDGPRSARVSRHVVDVPLNIAPVSAVPTDFSSAPDHDCSGQPCISATAFAKLVYAFAPHAAEVLNVKADNIYRQLSDSVIASNDADYVADANVNPLGYNRLDKARGLYAAAAHYCVHELVRDVDAAAAEENPFIEECRYAVAQKAKLDRGLNYFGLSSDFYLYAKPADVGALFDSLRSHGLARREQWTDAVAQLRDAIAEGVDVSIDAEIRETEIAEANTYIGAVMADIESSSTKVATTLESIGDLGEAIALSESSIDPLVAELETIIASLNECDGLCWASRVWTVVRAIVKIVAAIWNIDWAGAASAVVDVVDMLQNAVTAIDAVIAVSQYVSLLIDGEAGSVTYRAVSDCSSMGPIDYLDCVINNGAEVTVQADNAAAFKKNVIDPALTVVEQAIVLKEVTEQVIDQYDGNPLAEALATIKIQSDQLATALFDNLDGIYRVQSALAGDPAGFAKAKLLEDHIKQIMTLNRNLAEEYRNHVDASAEVYAKYIELDAARARVGLALKRYELETSRLASLEDDRLKAELMINATCRNSRALNDRMLLAQYLYRRAIAYLMLQGADEGAPYRNILREGDWNSYESGDLDQTLDSFVTNVLRPLRQPTVVTDIISPVEWEVMATVGALGTVYSFVRRSPSEIQDSLCPAGTNCAFNKEQYNHAFMTSLRQDGLASFEIYPESVADFRRLPDASKRAWNLGFTSSDEQYTRLRVMDAAVRLVMDAWTLPDPSIVSSLTVSHEQSARFRVAPDEYADLYFSGDSLATLCHATSAATGTALPCGAGRYFTKQLQTPFTEARSSYEDLSNVTVTELEASALYGTSVRGSWTVDLTSIIEQLETFQETNPAYNGCTAQAPCTAVEEFWAKFRGIEYKIYSVPIN